MGHEEGDSSVVLFIVIRRKKDITFTAVSTPCTTMTGMAMTGITTDNTTGMMTAPVQAITVQRPMMAGQTPRSAPATTATAPAS